MFLTEKIEKAIVRSAELHRKQNRKASGAPYIVHPFAVAFLLAHYVEDEDVICAGLLHDVLEDVPSYGEEKMKEEFGENVYRIVKEVTEDRDPTDRFGIFSKKSDWKERKLRYLENLKNDSPEGMMIAAADKIHNIRSLVDGYASRGDAVWKLFRGEKSEILWFYESVLQVLRDHLKHPITDELERTFSESLSKFSPRRQK